MYCHILDVVRVVHLSHFLQAAGDMYTTFQDPDMPPLVQLAVNITCGARKKMDNSFASFLQGKTWRNIGAVATIPYTWETPCMVGGIRLYRSLAMDAMRQYGWQKTVGEYAAVTPPRSGGIKQSSVLILPHYRISRNVAIKVFRSDRRHDEEEVQILKRLTEGPTSHPGKSHVVQLLDQFELVGPNGRHLCLAVQALGPRIEPSALSPRPGWMLARQLVEAIAYFHDLGIVHGGTSKSQRCTIGGYSRLLPHRLVSQKYSVVRHQLIA